MKIILNADEVRSAIKDYVKAKTGMSKDKSQVSILEPGEDDIDRAVYFTGATVDFDPF